MSKDECVYYGHTGGRAHTALQPRASLHHGVTWSGPRSQFLDIEVRRVGHGETCTGPYMHVSQVFIRYTKQINVNLESPRSRTAQVRTAAHAIGSIYIAERARTFTSSGPARCPRLRFPQHAPLLSAHVTTRGPHTQSEVGSGERSVGTTVSYGTCPADGSAAAQERAEATTHPGHQYSTRAPRLAFARGERSGSSCS